ncbi:MAG: UDP-N-acetylmuramoyl-L-alanine--D-glutamate ligase [Dehalococcoidia bacterium]
MQPAQTLRGVRVTVVGLGIEGVDLVHFLTREGARVTVSDSRPAERLGSALAEIAEDAPELSLGAQDHPAVTNAEAVFVSQSVSWHLPALDAARARGVPVSSMARLFLERCPAPVAGITGSSGKTTTTALTGAILDAAGIDHVIGGNIGVGLLGLLERIGPATRVVAELSHTQLESVESSPHWACLTNVTPNHLDEFSWDEYVDLKRRIYAHQRPSDVAVFNLDDPVSRDLMPEAPGTVRATALETPLSCDGATLEDGYVVRREGGVTHRVVARAEVSLRGAHNLANVLQATALASMLGASDEAIAAAVRKFNGVPHRLEPVPSNDGLHWVNDSIATTPERTLAGLRSYEERVVLLLGGRDKKLPLADLAAEIAHRCRAVVTFGEAGDLFASAVRTGAPAVALERVGTIEEAVRAAARLARPGDVVLCSPAGTSFDAYPNFERRGEAFRAAVSALRGNA